MKYLCLAILGLSSSLALAEGFTELSKTEKAVWNSANHPSILLGKNYISKFTSLPLEGSVKSENAPWSDTYWPRYQGGISYRWPTKVSGYKYVTLKKSEVKNLTPEKIKALSPAEKFDLLRGDYRFPLTKKVKRKNAPDLPSWQGICHGWSQAAIHHPQARPVTLKNKHGLNIPFGASDIHALVSYYYGKVKIGGTKMMGQRCGEDVNTPACQDVNAGAFHVVLANLVGIEQKSFVLDVSQGPQVWNHPSHSYKSTVLKERTPSVGAAFGTVKEVYVRTHFTYVIEAMSTWEGRGSSNKIEMVYNYWLELDEEDAVIGGSWQGGHPDFLWVGTKAKFIGKFRTLKNLL